MNDAAPQELTPAEMLEHLEPLIGTKDITPYESGFLAWLCGQRDSGQVTPLTDAALTNLRKLHDQYYR